MPLFLTWLTVGITLVLLELLVPGTYLIWFGFSALLMGCITYLSGSFDLIYQLSLFGVMAFIFALIGWRVYGRLIFQTHTPESYRYLNDIMAQHLNKVVTVVDIKDDKIQISIGDTVWPAISEDAVKKGEKVLIVGTENNIIYKVKKFVDKNKKMK